MAWIAIDAGTSVIKAVAFDRSGHEIALARNKTDVLHPKPTFSEQSMEGVWAAVVASVRSVVEQLSEPVDGIAMTAQGDGCWLVDEAGKPVGNAILWNDGRATAEVEAATAAGAIERGFRVSGSVGYPGLSNAILQWLASNEPRRLQAARWVLSCNGWLFAQCTGRFAADLSDGSNPFGDVAAGNYADSLFGLSGVESYRRMMPPIGGGAELVAPLSAAAAGALNVKAGTPVLMAPYDIVATAYGAGAASAGQACLILGTTICAEVITDRLDLSVEPAGTTIALGDGLHLRAMPTLTGCETLEWATRMLGLESINALENLASSSKAGASGLLFLPYLSPAGERAPFLEPRASGSLHGLKLSHARADIARAVYEGLTFAIHECLQATGGNISELTVCGGGAQSTLWCQMIADVTGVTVSRSSGSEVGARGAFLCGLVGTGGAGSLAEAVALFPTAAEHFTPEPARKDLYRAGYALFLHTRNEQRSLWAAAGMSL